MPICRLIGQPLSWSCSPMLALLASDRLVISGSGRSSCQSPCRRQRMSQSPSSEKRHCNDLSGSCLVYFNSSHRAQTAKTVKCVQTMRLL